MCEISAASISFASIGRGRRRGAAEDEKALAKDRVGEQPDAVELDQDGGMADVGDPRGHRAIVADRW